MVPVYLELYQCYAGVCVWEKNKDRTERETMCVWRR